MQGAAEQHACTHSTCSLPSCLQCMSRLQVPLTYTLRY